MQVGVIILHAIVLCHMWLHQWGCIVVDQQCRESNGKAKIDEQAHQWDTCEASLMELEEVLVVEELTGEEVELMQEKVHYKVKRGQVVCQKVAVEEGEDEGEDEGRSDSEEEDNEPWTLGKGKGKVSCKVRWVCCMAPLVSLKYSVVYILL